MESKRILFLLVLFILSNSSCSENKELTAIIKKSDNSQLQLYRYYFTNKANNKVYFEFHYNDIIKGLERKNPLHLNIMFILFDICQFWNKSIDDDFNLGFYLDNKPLFDAIYFAPYRIDSISFNEIIDGEEIVVLQYSVNYINHPVLGSYAITEVDTRISGSKTYNHWPGGYSGYKIDYPDDKNEIHINYIDAMGGADFGSYYIGFLNNVHYMSELFSVKKTPSGIDLNDRNIYRRFIFLENGKLSEEYFYNKEGKVGRKKIYSYSEDTLSSNITSIKLVQIPGNSIKWEKKFEYNDNNQLIRINSANSILNEYVYNIYGLLEKDSRGNYEWKTLDKGIKVKAAISSSSYIDWNNKYLPALIFDNNPKTGWLESAEGSGIGQTIKVILEKEINIDEIAFMPGYFDPKWWSANNRVKKININFGRQDYIATFQDTMEIQTVKLPEQVSFKEVTFTIEEVYLSGNDNDTGISEIEFYDNGKKVEINVSGMN